jgi:hypothetical protein
MKLSTKNELAFELVPTTNEEILSIDKILTKV